LAAQASDPGKHRMRSPIMLDLILLTSGIAFFALSIGYVYVCDQL
jgi:hypothetical protein